jgi:hypothetical protein
MIIQPRDILYEGPNQQLTGGGNVLHRIQKAERLNNTSLPKMMIPSGTAESTRRRASGEGKLQVFVDVRGTNPLMVRVTTKVVINALSAAGSRIEPRTEPMLYFRAK